MKHCILKYGVPRVIKSDNGGSFKNAIMEELARILNVELRRGQPWHPESQATCERLNGTIMLKLSMYTEKEPKQWFKWLQYVVFSYNTMPHSTTMISPYKLVFNRFANLPIFAALKPQADGVAGDAQDYLAEAAKIAAESQEICSKNTSNMQTANERQRHKGSKQIFSNLENWSGSLFVLPQRRSYQKNWYVTSTKVLIKWCHAIVLEYFISYKVMKIENCQYSFIKTT
jgi:hypothetical protein